MAKNFINKASYKIGFEIRQIDAWNDGDGWTYNASFHIGVFTIKANDEKRAFLNALHRHGVVCKRGFCRVDFDGEIYELVNRKTGEPLYAAIPIAIPFEN